MLGQIITKVVMKQCPDVLSTGRLCKNDGSRHVWEPFADAPTLTRNGRTVNFEAKNFVPRISGFTCTGDADAVTCTPCMPALATAVVGVTDSLIEEVKGPSPSDRGVGVTDAEDFESSDPSPAPMRLVRESKLRAEAETAEHKRLHMPFNAFCKACVGAKRCRNQRGAATL
jgi:hypothetical protein